jgi:phosphoglycolate phosphatase
MSYEETAFFPFGFLFGRSRLGHGIPELGCASCHGQGHGWSCISRGWFGRNVLNRLTPMKRLIIFDLDGTLINAYPAVTQSVNHTLTQLGFPKKTAYQIKRAVGWGDRQLMAQFVGEDLADKALSIYRQHHLKSLRKGTRFLAGTRHILKWCKAQGMGLAIATNRPNMFTQIILEGLKIHHYFDQVLCADQLKHGKPHPMILRQICRQYGARKEQVFFVGDMTIDIRCGHNAGIKTIAVATGSNTKKELKELRPYKIIERINQLKQCIGKENHE